MKEVFVIQDLRTKEYFNWGRYDPYFTANIKDASYYDRFEGARNEVNPEYSERHDLLNDKFLQIITVYTTQNQTQ